LEDPRNDVEMMGLDLRFLVDESPILVDCGAKSTVYMALKEPELMTFEAGVGPLHSSETIPDSAPPGWVIRRGTPGRSEVVATMRRAAGTEPEGWIHVLDKRRCTAVAIAEFGDTSVLHNHGMRPSLDRIEIHGNGRFRFERRFLNEKIGQKIPTNPIKSLRLWLHFVTTPVQIGAVTSPQSMLTPLVVEWTSPIGPRDARCD
jgi:hypothetical protein